MYNFRSLSNKIASTLPRRFFGDFVYFFDPVLFVRFCFRGLIRSERKKKKKWYSSKGIISLWSALSFFFLRYKLNLVVTALQLKLVMTALEQTEYVRIAPRVFAKRRREE